MSEEIVIPDVAVEDPLAEDSPPVDGAAPEGEAGNPSPPEVVDPAINQKAVQERINKATRSKHEADRRADDLQRENDELRKQIKPPEEKVGTLEDFDYDEEARNKALINQQVKQQVSEAIQSQQATATQDKIAEEGRELADNFTTKEAEFKANNPDYPEAVANLPQFHSDTLNAIFSMDNGPQVAHYLGKHLDKADEIVNLSPVMAAARLGQISQALITNNKTISTSNAPVPVDTVGGGGSIDTPLENQSMEQIWANGSSKG